MKRMFLLALGGFLAMLLACQTSTGGKTKDVPRMTQEELKALLGKPGITILDVRAGRDWTGSRRKIAGAIREEPESVGSWASKYPKDKTIVLYCS
jgi:rhodanese-related sulfurtransferase